MLRVKQGICLRNIKKAKIIRDNRNRMAHNWNVWRNKAIKSKRSTYNAKELLINDLTKVVLALSAQPRPLLS